MYKDLIFVPIVLGIILIIYLYNRWDDWRATTAHNRKNKKKNNG